MSVYSEQNRNATYHSLEDLSMSKRRIVDLLTREPNGMTRHEIGERLRMPLSTVCGRVSELEGDGWLFSTDDTRETQYGKQATVVRLRSIEKPVQQQFQF